MTGTEVLNEFVVTNGAPASLGSAGRARIQGNFTRSMNEYLLRSKRDGIVKEKM